MPDRDILPHVGVVGGTSLKAKLPLDWRYLLIAAYLVFDLPNIADRIVAISGSALQVIVFAGLYGVLGASLFATAAIRSTPVRLIFAALFASGSILLQTYEWGMHQDLTYSAFLTLMDSRTEFTSGVVQYFDVLRWSVPVGLLLFFAIAAPPQSARIPSWLATCAPFGAIVLVVVLVFVRDGKGTAALPAPFAPAAFAAIKAGTSFSASVRQNVSIPRAHSAIGGDILLIVDESLSAQYLDINIRTVFTAD
ncbi:MAG: hypothetical protein KDE55_06725 [Novosphingobium sp.]|nr:hypothetical protein [Novosphingobium sp.]